ncbi:hypothetical protein PVK06_001582 [Gossypium arboreum]|uniref:Uncharacterized protein n=1 Tax=Gossypium arboreum TaxID=29729 RepID=A0ABR0R1E1_GOSAR|nr:hypothetical protein PVK06_001582 [Gossypium arboreum]
MLPKIKVFCWRIFHDILPTYDNIACIRQEFSTPCSRCKSEKEMLIHFMKDCPKVREILMMGGINNRLIDEPPIIPSISMHKRWTKPPDGVIKIKVDVAVVNGNVGYGAIARDHDGFVIGGCYSFANKSQDVNWAKFEAFVEGLNLALKLKVDKLILECDSAYLVNTVKKKDQDITILGCCINKAYRKFRNFTSVQVKWIRRCSNKAADFQCNLAITDKCNLYFNID